MSDSPRSGPQSLPGDKVVGNDSFIHSLMYSFNKRSLSARYVLSSRDAETRSTAPVLLGLSEPRGRQRAESEQYSLPGVSWRSVLGVMGASGPTRGRGAGHTEEGAFGRILKDEASLQVTRQEQPGGGGGGRRWGWGESEAMCVHLKMGRRCRCKGGGQPETALKAIVGIVNRVS